MIGDTRDELPPGTGTAGIDGIPGIEGTGAISGTPRFSGGGGPNFEPSSKSGTVETRAGGCSLGNFRGRGNRDIGRGEGSV